MLLLYESLHLLQTPLIHRLNLYLMAILPDFFALVVGEQQQVLTFCLSCSKQQAFNLTLAGLFGRDVVGDLDALLNFVAFANNES